MVCFLSAGSGCAASWCLSLSLWRYFTNALRITIAALLAQYVNPELAEGFFHAFSGLLLFVLSLAALAGFHALGGPCWAETDGDMNTVGRSWLRFSLLALLLAGDYGLLRARDHEEVLPPHDTFAELPSGSWRLAGQGHPISPDTLEVLGPGDFLARDYFNPSQREVGESVHCFFP